MTLGKITFDNSVKYISKSVQNQERDSKPKTMKTYPIPRKQNKIISQNNGKLIAKKTASGSKIIER